MENPYEHGWQNDPRLHGMKPEKIACLTAFSEELSKTPDRQKMNVFLKFQRQMRQENLNFSPEEQDLLFQILTGTLSPEDRKKAAMIRRLAGRTR